MKHKSELEELIQSNKQGMIIRHILMERIKQDCKWGVQNHDNFKWLAILAEEFGEIGKNVCEQIPENNSKYSKKALIDNLKYELEQVAAVCVSWRECLERNKETTTPEDEEQ